MKNIFPPLVAVSFTAFTAWVIVRQGYFGFITLALRDPWGLQLLLDLAIAMALVGSWLHRDARKRGIPALPYLMALPFLGSIAALAYLIHRNAKASRSVQSLGRSGEAPAS